MQSNNQAIRKLQRKTLIPAQIVGYALTLLVGVTIVLLAFQLYSDVKPLVTHQTDIFNAHTVTISKNVTLFKSANKNAIYFDDNEIEQLTQQEFVKKVAPFSSASFSVYAYINLGNGHKFGTDLFFESLPDEYIDVESDAWHWDSASGFLPIIIPKDYLQLYNFGFAESQSMPVVSEATVQQISFNIVIEGNGKRRSFVSRIVGFSAKINSILVPDDFLHWANGIYGSGTSLSPSPDEGNVKQGPSRLLVEFNDASDERISAFFHNNNLNINQSELENSKALFLFRFALVFVLAIAVIIIILSMAFIVMSLNLIVQKNRDLFVNLYNIGYSVTQIGKYYQIMVSVITVADLMLALAVALVLRDSYVSRLSALFSVPGGTMPIWISVASLATILLVSYNLLIRHIILKTVGQK